MQAGILTSTSGDTKTYRERITPELFDRMACRIAQDESIELRDAEHIVDGAIGFLLLCATHPGRQFGPSRKIDTGWHTFILYTREYTAFCHSIAGEYIHHAPTDGDAGSLHGVMATSEVMAFMDVRGITYDREMWSNDCAANEHSSDCTACTGCFRCSPPD